jgi:hypothetical protein
MAELSIPTPRNIVFGVNVNRWRGDNTPGLFQERSSPLYSFVFSAFWASLSCSNAAETRGAIPAKADSLNPAILIFHILSKQAG